MLSRPTIGAWLLLQRKEPHSSLVYLSYWRPCVFVIWGEGGRGDQWTHTMSICIDCNYISIHTNKLTLDDSLVFRKASWHAKRRQVAMNSKNNLPCQVIVSCHDKVSTSVPVGSIVSLGSPLVVAEALACLQVFLCCLGVGTNDWPTSTWSRCCSGGKLDALLFSTH
jgi:hypothetical protein